jgi:hypothetical protein
MVFSSFREPFIFDHPYHKYRGYCITDYALKSCIFFKADGLWKVAGFDTCGNSGDIIPIIVIDLPGIGIGPPITPSSMFIRDGTFPIAFTGDALLSKPSSETYHIDVISQFNTFMAGESCR